MTALVTGREIAAPARAGLSFPRPGWRTAFVALAFLGYLAAAWVIVLRDHSIIGDAWSRVANAYYVLFSRDPHLASIGFVWNPLPSLAVLPLLPLKAIWPPLVATGFVASIVSAACAAGAVWQLDGMAADWRVGRLARIAIVGTFALNPMIVYYAANGMSEAMFVFTMLVATRYLSRWALGGGVAPLSIAGIALAAAYLTRYEAAAAALGAASVVVVLTVARTLAGGRTDTRPWATLRALAATRRTELRQLAVFGAIGVLSTLAYVVLYAVLRDEGWGPAPANAAALLTTAVANTAANRRLTFGVRGGERLGKHHVAGLVAFGIALAITSAAVWLLAATAPGASRTVEIAVLVAANAVATAVRFLVLRRAIAPASAPTAATRARSSTRRAAVDEAVADLLVFLLPFALTFVSWAIASWLIVGDPFQQFTSVYGVASQLHVAQDGIAAFTGQGTGGAIWWVVRQMVGLEPGLALLVVLAAMAILAGRPRAAAMIMPAAGILGAVVAFSVFGFLTGRTLGWMRYFIAIVPLAAVLALAIASLIGQGEGRGRSLRGVRPSLGALATALGILAVVVALPVSANSMLDTSLNPPYGGEAFQLRPVVFGEQSGLITASGQYDVGAKAAAYVDALHLPTGSVLVDAAMGFPIILQSSTPRQFIVTPDRDFQQALADPASFGVRYLLVPEDVGYQSLDAINRTYPGMYSRGAPFVRLVQQFSAGGNSWRLYQVIAQ